jgi:hypothetical protein
MCTFDVVSEPEPLYRIEAKTPKGGTLFIFTDKSLEEVEAIKFGFAKEIDIKISISEQKKIPS